MLRDDASGFPRRLRQLRLELGWSLDDLARAIETGRGTVSNWEATTERQREPSIGVLLALARWFGVSMDYLFAVPGADRDSPQVRQAKARVRERFVREVKSLSVPTSGRRFRMAVTILQEEAPEAYWPARIAAHLLLPLETYELMLNQDGIPEAVVERFAHFAGLPPAWFAMRPTDISM